MKYSEDETVKIKHSKILFHLSLLPANILLFYFVSLQKNLWILKNIIYTLVYQMPNLKQETVSFFSLFSRCASPRSIRSLQLAPKTGLSRHNSFLVTSRH